MRQVATYKTSQTMKNNKPSGQKVVAVSYGRWSFMRGSDCRHLTGKSLVLLIGGRL